MARRYPYLIVGGGMTGDAACRGIRQADESGAIGLIGAEPDPPYNRPPLSKGLWKVTRPTPLSRIWRRTETLGVDLHLGRSAVRLDPSAHTLTDDQGEVYEYGKLLLATGGEAIRLGPEHKRVVAFRTLADYHRLRGLADAHSRFIVIGGGFIGSEMAAALAGQGKEVTMVFPEAGLCARVLPEAAALRLNDLFREQGVRVLTGQMVRSVEPEGDVVRVLTEQGETLAADAVVQGLGIRPNVSLAQSAGLALAPREEGGGILVDEHLQTSAADIFAAGDVANFYNLVLARRMRVEHEENANSSGQVAGQNMAGQTVRYDSLPSVYSTLFDVNYDAVGVLDPRLETVMDWQEPFVKGAIYYLEDKRVRGVLLWNVQRGLDRARELIAAEGPVGDLKGMIV